MVNRIALTDAKLRKLKPQAQAYELGGGGCPGLRVLRSGKINYRCTTVMSTRSNG